LLNKSAALHTHTQTDAQLNTLDELEAAIDNSTNSYFSVQNGYTFTQSSERLAALSQVIAARRQELLDLIKIGVHADVGVNFSGRSVAKGMIPTNSDTPVTVTQAYCSALSVGYAGVGPASVWQPFAQLILDAAYEATLWAAVVNEQRTGVKDVFLTLVGGGVFRNEFEWISAAIGRAVSLLRAAGADLKVHVCHFRQIDSNMESMITAAIVDAEQQQTC
jgi:hypothetical protein